MEIVKRIACFVLSFIICICIVCTAISAVAVFALGSEGYWMNRAKNVDYYSRLSDGLEAQLKTYSVPSGIPEWVFDGIVSEERIEGDIRKQIEAARSQEFYTVDLTSVKAEFYSVFENYAIENGYEMSEEQKANLLGLADICVEEYSSYISLSVFTLMMRYVTSYKKSLYIIAGIALLIMVFACFVLVINKKKAALRYFAYSTSGASLFLFVPGFFVYVLKLFSKFYFRPDYMYDFFANLIRGAVDILSLISLALLITAVALAIIEAIKKKDGCESDQKSDGQTQAEKEEQTENYENKKEA